MALLRQRPHVTKHLQQGINQSGPLNSTTYQKDTIFMAFHSENLQLDPPVGEKHGTSPDRVFTGRLGNGMDVIVIRDHRRPIATHGDTGPSTPVACAAADSDATKRRSEAKKLRPKTEAPDEIRSQLMKRVITGIVVTFCLLVATPSLAAADNALFSSDDGNFVVFGGLGLANIKAQEFAYYGDHKNSQLNWESKGMTLFTVGADAQFDNGWSVKSSVEIGTGGNGHMVDYDWASPGHEDWSDRSIHDLTELDHYVAGAIQLDRSIYDNETSSIAVGAGFQYTDVKWTAYGGWGTYTTEKFRDTPVSWPDWQRAISYRQQIPIGFLSLSGEYNFGDLTISGDLQTGLSFGINAIDDHWGRHLRFDEDINPAPTIGATVALDYAMTPAASLHLSGSFQQVFNSHGEMQFEDTKEGTRSAWKKDAAGANFQSMSISIGLNFTF
ncbi:omptin family outer membrane protease [Rhizobium leguminosarum]|uniref:omptin family outer membrane protease n=1 Tax=Rhizobium leguminosarum TaxID=384 RepID=UPI001FDEE7FD|nr:omptin family outer membrane protease [Rhizobium leguminosarum]